MARTKASHKKAIKDAIFRVVRLNSIIRFTDDMVNDIYKDLFKTTPNEVFWSVALAMKGLSASS